MLEITRYMLVLLAANMVGCACVFVPSRAESPVRALQLRILHSAATRGPGGFDDAVQTQILQDPSRYALGIAKLLSAEAGSDNVEVGLYFAEYVTDNPSVRRELEGLLIRVEEQQDKAFIAKLLGESPSRPPEQPGPTIRRIF